MAEFKPANSILAHGATATAVSYSKDSKHFASGSKDKTVKIFDAHKWDELRTLRGHQGPVMCLAFHPRHAAQLATGSRDKTVKLWDTATGHGIRTFRGHGGPVLALCFSPSGDRMVSGGDAGMVIEWDTATGDVLRRLEGHAGGVFGVSMSPPGRRFVASGSDDFTMKLWNLATGTVLKTVKHKDAVHDVAFSTVDNHIVASACRDRCVYVWHVDTGDCMFAFEGHADVVNHICFSPDGWRLLSASADTTAKLWSMDTCELLGTFKGHNSNVSGVACSPDNQWIVTSGWDCTVKVWPHGAADDRGKRQSQRPFPADRPKKAAPAAKAPSSPKPSPKAAQAAATVSPTPSPQADQSPKGSPRVPRKAAAADDEARRALEKKLMQSEQAAFRMLDEEKQARAAAERQLSEVSAKLASYEGAASGAARREQHLETSQAKRLREVEDHLRLERAAREEVEQLMERERERWHTPETELQVGREIMNTGAATVHLGKWLGSPVCIKVLQEELRSQYYVQGWEKELATRASLTHPNLVAFYGATLAPHKQPSLVVERMLGSLSETAAMSERLNCREVSDICADVVSAFAFLHAREMPHGSVYGASVLVTEEMTAKISALGEYAAIQATFARPPPRHAHCPAIEEDAFQRDIWSFGAVLLEAATGMPPDEEMRASQLTKVAWEPLQALAASCLGPAESRPTSQVLLGMMEQLRGEDVYEPYFTCPPRRKLRRGEFGLTFDTPVSTRKLPSTPTAAKSH